MSTSTPNTIEEATAQPSEQDALQQRVRELEAQLAAARKAETGVSDDSDRPWSVAAQNAGPEHTRDVAPLPYRGPGAVLHHFPHLTGGSGGPQNAPYVRKVAELLAELGYDQNGVIRGELNHFDNSLLADVRRFQAEHDIREPVNAYQGHPHTAQDVVRNLVGPYTIQALFEKAADKLDQPVADLIARVEYEVSHQQAHRVG